MCEAAARLLPKHTAAAAWKHRNLSHVEPDGHPPMPKDRGAEQGDVDGPVVAAETRGRVAALQASGGYSWIGADVTPRKSSACKLNTLTECRESPCSLSESDSMSGHPMFGVVVPFLLIFIAFSCHIVPCTSLAQSPPKKGVQRLSNFQVGGPEKLTGADDPRRVLQTKGVLTDIWYGRRPTYWNSMSQTPKLERSTTH